MIVSLGLIRVAVPASPTSDAAWLSDPVKRATVNFAINLVPFAGIAFLWFMGVLRNRLGELEDQFFATVFLGSGLLFVVSLYAASAMSGAFLAGLSAESSIVRTDSTYNFARDVVNATLNVFGMKMAGAFIFSTCVIGLRTGIFARWVAVTGFACGLILLLVIGTWKWIQLLFPFWMLLLSTYILITDLRWSKKRVR